MQQIRQLSEQLLLRDAAFVVLFGFGVMVAFSFRLATAFSAAGLVALLFSVGMILRAWRLTAAHVPRLEAWHHVFPENRPQDDVSLSWAREQVQEVFLHAAKTAASVAIGLCGAAFALEFIG